MKKFAWRFGSVDAESDRGRGRLGEARLAGDEVRMNQDYYKSSEKERTESAVHFVSPEAGLAKGYDKRATALGLVEMSEKVLANRVDLLLGTRAARPH